MKEMYLRRHRTSAAAAVASSLSRRAHPAAARQAPLDPAVRPFCAALRELEVACCGNEETHIACALLRDIVRTLLANREDRKYRYLVVGELLRSRLLRHGESAVDSLTALGYSRRVDEIDEFAIDGEIDWELLGLAEAALQAVIERVDGVEDAQVVGAGELGRKLFAHSLHKDNGGVAWAI